MLDSATLALFLPAVLLLAIVPGPDLALIVSQSLARGARAGVWCTVGIALAGFIQTALVALGLGHVLQRMPVLAEVVRLVGAAYLLWLGVGMLTAALRRGAPSSMTAGGADRETPLGWLARGLVTNLLNPKALLFFSLFLPQFVTVDGDAIQLQIALLGVILTLVVMSVNVGVACAAASLRRTLRTSGRFDALATGTLGAVFVGLAVRVALQESRAR